MNVKAGRKTEKIKLKGMKPTKRDLVNIEKIVLKRVKPTDHYVVMGKKKDIFREKSMTWSSARYLPNDVEFFRDIEIVFKSPNMSVRFDRFRTEIIGQRLYRKGRQLEKIDDSLKEISKYLMEAY